MSMYAQAPYNPSYQQAVAAAAAGYPMQGYPSFPQQQAQFAMVPAVGQMAMAPPPGAIVVAGPVAAVPITSPAYWTAPMWGIPKWALLGGTLASLGIGTWWFMNRSKKAGAAPRSARRDPARSRSSSRSSSKPAPSGFAMFASGGHKPFGGSKSRSSASAPAASASANRDPARSRGRRKGKARKRSTTKRRR